VTRRTSKRSTPDDLARWMDLGRALRHRHPAMFEAYVAQAETFAAALTDDTAAPAREVLS
jgi:hypothetical protein